MPRDIETILENHHAAQARRDSGQPVWDRTVLLGGVFRNQEMTFEQRRDGIVAALRSSGWPRVAADPQGLAELFEELADTADGDSFDVVWDVVYDVANEDRVWIDTVSTRR